MREPPSLPPAPSYRARRRGRSRRLRGGGGARMSPECEEPPPPRAGERPLRAPLPRRRVPRLRQDSPPAPGPRRSARTSLPPPPAPRCLVFPQQPTSPVSPPVQLPPPRTQPHCPGTSPFPHRPPPLEHPLPALGFPGPGSGPTGAVGLCLPPARLNVCGGLGKRPIALRAGLLRAGGGGRGHKGPAGQSQLVVL